MSGTNNQDGPWGQQHDPNLWQDNQWSGEAQNHHWDRSGEAQDRWAGEPQSPNWGGAGEAQSPNWGGAGEAQNAHWGGPAGPSSGGPGQPAPPGAAWQQGFQPGPGGSSWPALPDPVPQPATQKKSRAGLVAGIILGSVLLLGILGTALMVNAGKRVDRMATATPSNGVASAPATTEPPTTQASSAAAAPATTSTDVPGGQATADLAGQAFLRSFGEGNAKAVCSVMTSGGIVFSDDPADLQICADTMEPTIDSLSSSMTEFRTATVTGATVAGDTASFSGATIRPSTGRAMLSGFEAKRVKGKWYISAD